MLFLYAFCICCLRLCVDPAVINWNYLQWMDRKWLEWSDKAKWSVNKQRNHKVSACCSKHTMKLEIWNFINGNYKIIHSRKCPIWKFSTTASVCTFLYSCVWKVYIKLNCALIKWENFYNKKYVVCTIYPYITYFIVCALICWIDKMWPYRVSIRNACNYLEPI